MSQDEVQDALDPIKSVKAAELTRFWRESFADLESQQKAERINRYLQEQAVWASELLTELVHGQNAGPYDKLNPQALNSCEGLAFLNCKKGGLGFTVGHGYGFMIKKILQDQHGNSSWSQPLFFTVSQAGLGVSAGYQHMQSVVALLSLGSLDVFKKGTNSLGTDLGLFSTDGALLGMSGGAAFGSSQHLGLSVANTHSAFCYSKVHGVYWELGMHGSSIAPDHESNGALYGPAYDADEVLSKGGQCMPDMLPLLRTINLFGKAAMTGTPVPPPDKA